MGEDFDDTRTSPLRAIPVPENMSSRALANQCDIDVADTILVPRRNIDGLVEPDPEPIRRGTVDAALAPPLSEASSELGLYSFRVGEHAEPILLDRAARIGRNPAASRINVGPLPSLIRVASPRSEVSATHLEVRQVGSSVVVTDLRSTNGCVVSQPGGTPRTIRQGESVVVSPGALVDIGDGNIVRILPMQDLGLRNRGGSSD